jgi:glycosyltransferase involved in cell wall biosynthesis
VISVVVPTKGRVRSLSRCLEALERADYDRDRFEVVVSNDRGTQEVESLVAGFGDRLRVSTTTPERSGPSAARNAGAAAASGEYVAFTDDDCEPEAGWLSALERSLSANPGAAAGGTVRNGVTRNLGAVATQAVVDALHAGFNRDLGAPRFFASSNVAFPSHRFRSVGGFDEDERYAEDRDLCERWIAAGNRFVATPDAVVVHMRTLDLREFVGQHYGYGRGAFAFNGVQSSERRRGDRMAVLEGLVRESLRRHDGQSRPALAAYLLLSQLATATGFVREAVARSIVRARS